MKLISKIYLKLTGWKVESNPPKEIHEKCVMICAPHTSNWDFPTTLAIMSILNVKARYAIKKELMGLPFGPLLRAVGGIAINRKPKKEGEKRQSTVQAIADLFSKEDKLCLMIAAEGTRSLQKEWKTGFYYIALQAKVPICLGYLDYKTKIGGFGKVVHPTGDIHADMAEIMDFFKDKTAKKPANFSLDYRFIQEDHLSDQNK
ncbi:1-acyl-sn-glycerol-3-phosphate acyltransferase [Aureispira anguillae]|uniref:1-acyl-sn-glycerol-3-phosphate acyltransferase n=1 Tax=Aureispira anguillae TaxID=2864201 RepID=A0A916DVN7_9BACT|nr:1-acyl-sn-glycerol-3-phosphate acyltransferase [Aureispira anguillae]BDS13765.1 1-acyl-sn-glycerol-3-phosphate acyltransferase [Aureispira anguillae]